VILTRRERFAMQKVEGSSPFIRSKHPAKRSVQFAPLRTKNVILSPERVEHHVAFACALDLRTGLRSSRKRLRFSHGCVGGGDPAF
jgi:hypothetical protein